MPETGFSMVKCFRTCPRKYFYAYVRKLQAKRKQKPLKEGTILHEMLEARAIKNGAAAMDVLYKYRHEYRTLLAEEREYYGANFIEDLLRIYEGYCRTYRGDGWKVEAAEEFIATDLTRDIRFVGHIDLRVTTSKDGRHWLVDHKCPKVIPDEHERFSNYQLLLYVWAYNRERSDKVDGIIWDYLRRKAPTIPEVLKKGGLSQAQNIDTDVYTYDKAIQDNELDPEDYAEYLAHLRRREPGRFFLRVTLPTPSREMTEQVVEEFRQTSIIMHGLKVYPRNMTFMCKGCEFYNLCQAELRGLDAKFIEKTQYEPAERRDEDEEE